MKMVFGILMIVGGIALAIYLGIWVCFIGGIVEIINEIRSSQPVVAMNIAWGILRIVISGAVGWGSAILLVIPGIYVVAKK